MKCLIVSGGTKPDKNIINKYSNESDLIIGVDKGCNYLYDSNILPHYIVGDFDSSSSDIIDKLVTAKAKKHIYNCEKDFSDSDSAFQLAIDKKVKEIFFLGATGGRLDHGLANIGLLLRALNNNIKASIIDNKNKIYLINSSGIIKKDTDYKYISFLAYDKDVLGFKIKNAKYNLDGYDLKVGDGSGRTISNEFLDTDISVEFTEGSLLVIYSKD